MSILLDDGIAVVTIENPPLNTLSLGARQRLFADVAAALADDAVRAVVVRGAGNVFCAGAEVREFGSDAATAFPDNNDITAIMDAATKPVLALIEGFALGGGLEIALGCHFRIAAESARLALPEVKLGVLPGAGGTQRLPRLIGVEPALKVMTEGQHLSAREAATLGVVDAVAEGDPFDYAAEFLRARPSATPGTPLRDRPARFVDEAVRGAGREAFVAAAAARSRGAPAPSLIAECVWDAATLPFDQGMVLERERFLALESGPESRALRHLFFAERAARRITGVDHNTQIRPLATAGVVGAGTMGTGIALALALGGLDVRVVESSEAALARSAKATADALASMVRRGRCDAAAAEDASARIVRGKELEALATADLVIEAVPEDMAIKRTIFERLDRIARPGAILATNTSFLDVDALASATSRPGDVVGLHFFSPAHMMRLLEIVRGPRTSPGVLATVIKLAQRIGKVGVVARTCDGFIGNRMIDRYLLRAYEVVAAGASPAQVDGALERFGMAMGPFAMQDLSGNDIGFAVRQRKMSEDPTYHCPGYVDELCRMGWFGQKTGQGWYRYEPGSRKPLPHPAADVLIEKWRAEQGVKPRAFTDAEIVERCIYALVDEGSRILAEGVAERASDIDLVYAMGYGFPEVRGGPMFHAEEVGLKQVVASLQRFGREEPSHGLDVAPLLVTAAELGSFDAATSAARTAEHA